MKKRKIIILGASGMLGGCLIKTLNDRFHVVGVSRDKNPMTQYDCDLTDLNKLDGILDRERAEIIVNCAAITDLNYCQKNINEAFLINCFLPKFISKRPERIIHISTDSVFGDDKGWYTEDATTKPLNVYAMSKFMGEIPVLDNAGLVIRVNIYGFNMVMNKEKNSLFEWVVRSIENNTKICGYEDVVFNPVSIFRLSKIIEFLIDKKLNGVLNVGSKDAVSKAEFISRLIKLNREDYNGFMKGFQPDSELKRSKNTSLCVNKMYTQGIEPIDLDDDLKLTVNMYRKLKVKNNDLLPQGGQG